MHPAIRVELLGALRFSVGTAEVDRFRTKKVAELLAYLAFHRDRICTRDELATLLWPEEYDQTAGFNRLSNALSALRTQLEPAGASRGSALDGGRYSVRLRSETVSVDLLDFKAAIKAGSIAGALEGRIGHTERAFQLYRGDFAPTLDSDWVSAERVRLQDAYGLLLGNLRDLWKEAGDLSLALDYGSRLVELDPYSEASHSELIRLYLLAGKNAAAHEQFAVLGKVLEELDATPSPETIALLETAQQRSPTLRKPFAQPPPRAFDRAYESNDLTDNWAIRPSLPFQTTRFFGREAEIGLGLEMLGREGARLITLIGPGGSGKTRLSIEIAKAATDMFDGSVFFAALADVTDPALLADAILAGIGANRQSTMSATGQIATALSPNPASLLVFDNVEQVVEEAGAMAEELLSLVPGLKVIATSRRNLNLTGEIEMHVAPLPLPLPDYDLAPREMIASASVALFVDRAQHVCADFQLTQRNAPAVAELCRKLDGIPLAIELAATWAKTYSPQQMLMQLARRFDFLVTRRRDVPARHQKMLAIIESSYMLLDPDLRLFLLKLATFQGGWTMEAAEAVCKAPRAGNWLQELLERTLITSAQLETEDGDCTMRFGMLETIKAFCECQIDPEAKEELLLAHANYFAEFAEREGQGFYSYEMKMPVRAFAADLPNYRLALGTALGGTALGLSLWRQPSSILLHTYQGWEDLGLFEELLDWLVRVPTNGMDPRTHAFMVRHEARCNSESGQREAALALFEDCLERFRELGEKEGIAGTLANLSKTHLERGEFEAAFSRMEDALGLARELGNKPLLARMLGIRGGLLIAMRQPASARESYREMLLLSNGEGSSAIQACMGLADLEVVEQNHVEAQDLYGTALNILARYPRQWNEAFVHIRRGTCAEDQGLAELADASFEAALAIVRRSHDSRCIRALFEAVAQVALRRNDSWTALVLVCAIETWGNRTPALRSLDDEDARLALSVRALSEKLGAARAQKAISVGQAMRPGEGLRFVEEFLKNSNANLAQQKDLRVVENSPVTVRAHSKKGRHLI